MEHQCPQCPRKFKEKMHLGRHLSTAHKTKPVKKKKLKRSQDRIRGLKFLEGRTPEEVLDTMSDALAALRELFSEQATKIKIMERDIAQHADIMKKITGFTETLKKEKRLGDLT